MVRPLHSAGDRGSMLHHSGTRGGLAYSVGTRSARKVRWPRAARRRSPARRGGSPTRTLARERAQAADVPSRSAHLRSQIHLAEFAGGVGDTAEANRADNLPGAVHKQVERATACKVARLDDVEVSVRAARIGLEAMLGEGSKDKALNRGAIVNWLLVSGSSALHGKRSKWPNVAHHRPLESAVHVRQQPVIHPSCRRIAATAVGPSVAPISPFSNAWSRSA